MSFFRRKPKAPESERAIEPSPLLGLIYCDADLPEWRPWPTEVAEQEPWPMVEQARQKLSQGDRAGAVESLQRIALAPGLASHHYLGAWHCLRKLAVVPPPEIAKQLHGAVFEYQMPEGMDVVAAYQDGHACYFNHSGRSIHWAPGPGAIHAKIQDFLASFGKVIARAGPAEGDRPRSLPVGCVRVMALTPIGIHYGEAPFDVLAKDDVAGPVVMSAQKLMMTMIDLARDRPRS